jgi:hypothetical protein
MNHTMGTELKAANIIVSRDGTGLQGEQFPWESLRGV